MAAAIGLVASSVVGSFAFSGADFLFSRIDKDGYLEEQKMYNRAMERMQERQKAWERKRAEIADRKEKVMLSNKNIEATNNEIRLLSAQMPTESTFPEEYEMGEEMQKYYDAVRTAVVGVAVLGSSYFVSRVIKCVRRTRPPE